MGKKPHLTPTKRARITTFHELGLTERAISSRLKVSKTAVHNAIKLYQETNQFHDRPGPGRKRKTTTSDDRWIVRMVKKSPFKTSSQVQKLLGDSGVIVSSSTVRKRLISDGLCAYTPARKPRLTSAMKAKRLAFAHKYKKWTVEDWRKVMWSDESHFEQFGTKRCYVRRKSGCRFQENCILPTVKHCESVMVWGCFSWMGRGSLEFLDKNERMNSERYINILQSKLPMIMNLHGTDIFMQDGAPCHTAKKSMAWFHSNHVSVLEWPGNSPDINPIENLWKLMKRKVSAKNPSSLDDLKQVIKEVWVMEITQQLCHQLCESMPRRIAAVISAKGGSTKY